MLWKIVEAILWRLPRPWLDWIAATSKRWADKTARADQFCKTARDGRERLGFWKYVAQVWRETERK